MGSLNSLHIKEELSRIIGKVKIYKKNNDQKVQISAN